MPEEVHGARLAVEPAAELLENGVRPVQDAAEALDGLPIPRGVLEVLWEGRRRGDAERLLLDLDVDSERGERCVHTRVELCDGLATHELERLGSTVGCADEQRMVDEVEVDLERRATMM